MTNIKNKQTVHFSCDRGKRKYIIKQIGGTGEIIETFTVNRGHKDGPELHSLTSTGIIVIRNANTGMVITKLIARPSQIRRYYESENRTPPKKLMLIAYKHWKKGFYHA